MWRLSANKLSIMSSKARIKFLEDSANLYSVSAPSVSAHLMLQRKEVAAANERSEEDAPNPICQACGTTLIPGWTSSTTIGDQKEKRMNISSRRSEGSIHRQDTTASAKSITVECLACHRYTKSSLMKPQPRGNSVTKASISRVQKNGGTSLPDLIKTPRLEIANSSSKQRAKARKQGRLQALLAKSRRTSSPASGSGLDLMDLMKQG